jgi:hypothetical protein
MSLPDRITEFVRQWPQWSPAERRHLDAITSEVIDHCANGTGNGFIRWFVAVHLAPAIPALTPGR